MLCFVYRLRSNFILFLCISLYFFLDIILLLFKNRIRKLFYVHGSTLDLDLCAFTRRRMLSFITKFCQVFFVRKPTSQYCLLPSCVITINTKIKNIFCHICLHQIWNTYILCLYKRRMLS
jgi:hypothetical protein